MSSLLFSFAATGVGAQSAMTKDYEPTVNWPYLLNDFYQGTIILSDGTPSHARLNFHLRSQRLDCIDTQGKVGHVIFPNIDLISINGNIYRIIDGKPMQQLHAEQDAMLLEHVYIDYELIDKEKYKYGMALYARATSDISMQANWNNSINLQTLHMSGEFNEPYLELRNAWYDGIKLPVRHVRYFSVKGNAFRAIPSDTYALLSADARKQLRSYIKSNKLKWSRQEDLTQILKQLKEAM